MFAERYNLTFNRNVPISSVTSEPAIEPVTKEECKRHAYIIDDSSDDAMIDDVYIPAARRVVEQLANRSLITQTRVQYGDWLKGVIYWRYGPLQSVTSITYKDSNEDQQTLAATNYTVDTDSIPARIIEGYNQTYPTAIVDTHSVAVTGVAGYGATRATVPIIYRLAIMKLVTHWLNNRGMCSDDESQSVLMDLIAMEGATVEYA